MSSDEIKAILVALDKAKSADNEADMITNLESIRDQLKPSEEILRETKAGVAIGKLRTHATPSVATLAKSIVKAWKEVVEENKKRKAADGGEGASSGTSKKKVKSEKGTGGSNSNTPTRSVSPSSTSKAKDSSSSKPSSSSNKDRPIASLPSSSSSKPSSSSTTKKEPKKEKDSSSSSTAADFDSTSDSAFPTIVEPYPETPRTFKSDRAHHPGLGDDIRDKCVMLVYDSLAGDSNATKDVIMEKSKAVERGFYNKNDNSTDNTYRQSMRGICMNLKDKSNPGLRDAVIRGVILGKTICDLSKEEIANSTLQALNKKLETENLFNSRGAEQIAAETDQFKCGKCGFRKTTYYQMQTRSADEPMTTFVTCLNCNNRWKFS